MNNFPLSYLTCPKCHTSLKKKQNKLICLKNHKYAVSNGVPIMANLNDYLEIEAKAWEDEWQTEVKRSALSSYKKNMNVFRRLGFWEESGEAASIIPSKLNYTVLDLGCGNGVSTHNIKGGVKFGLDLSETQLIRAKQKFKDCTFVVGDARHLPFKSETFDLIVAINMLHHVQDPEKVLKDCYRVLKKGGVLLTVDPNLYNPIGFIGRGIFQLLDLRWLFPAFPQFALGKDEYQFSKTAYHKLFSQSPFKSYQIKPHRIERLLFFATILAPQLGRLPFYESILFYTSKWGNKLVMIPPIDWICYFWMGRAVK